MSQPATEPGNPLASREQLTDHAALSSKLIDMADRARQIGRNTAAAPEEPKRQT
jgi:hypothetical protein